MKIYFTAEVTDLGKFDGILICSDIDGTILENSTFGSIFEKNAEAVKHFTDNGGRFTFITGRYKFFSEGYASVSADKRTRRHF